ncbi:MAG: hypothetical protein Q9167_006043 [Letrouitia subvulpina]
MSAPPERLFAITICAKRKPGMDENEYHEYISKKHAGHLKDLLVKNRIIDYTMNLDKLFPNLSSMNRAPYDAFVQVVFRDYQDYINVKDDPHYMNAVDPDHVNFVDGPNTMMSFGWFERHIVDGKVV